MTPEWGAIDWAAVPALAVVRDRGARRRELLSIEVWIDARPALSHGWSRANEALPALSHGWSGPKDGASWTHPSGTVVLESIARHAGHVWYHLSASRPYGIIDFNRLKQIRSAFLGDEIEAYMIFPPPSRWVNIDPRVLHLWAALDAPDGVLPKMEGTVAGVRSI